MHKRIGLVVILFLAAGGLFAGTSGDEELLYQAGQRRFDQKDYALARDLFQEFLDSYPLSVQVPDAAFRLGVSSYMTGDPAGALALFERVENRYSSTAFLPIVPFWKGICRYALGDFDIAAREFGRYLEGSDDSLQREALRYEAASYEAAGVQAAALDAALGVLDQGYDPYAGALASSLYLAQDNYTAVLELNDRLEVPGETDPDSYEEYRRFYAAEAAYASEGDPRGFEALTSAGEPTIRALSYLRLYEAFPDRRADLLPRAEKSLEGRPDLLGDLWLRAAAEAVARGDDSAAELLLNRLDQQASGADLSPLVPVYRAEMAARAGNPQEAEEILREYLSRGGPADAEILIRRARYLLLLGRDAEARDAAERLLARYPQGEKAPAAALMLVQIQGRADRAIQALALYDRYTESPGWGPLEAAARRLQIELLMKEGLDDRARAALAEYRTLYPRDLDSALLELRTRFQARDWPAFDRALGELNRTASRELRTSPELQFDLASLTGLAALARGEYSRARVILRGLDSRRLDEAPGGDRLIFYRGWASYRLGDYGAALGDFLTAADRAGDADLAGEAIYLAGWSAYSLEQWDPAVRYFRDYAVAVSGEDRDRGRLMEARSLGARGSYEEALKLLRRLGDSGRERTASEALYEGGVLAARSGRIDEALNFYKDLQDRYPGSSLAVQGAFSRGELLLSREEYPDARKAFYDFRSAYPESSLIDGALYWGGEAALRDQEPFGAVLLWERLIQDHPDSPFRPEALIKTAEVYAADRQFVLARSFYDTYLREYPRDAGVSEVSRAREKLGFLAEGQARREAELSALIRSSGGETTARGRQAMVDLAAMVLLGSGAKTPASEARNLLDRVIAQEEPQSSARAWFVKAEDAEGRRQWRTAVEAYLKSASLDSGNEDFAARALYQAVRTAETAGNRGSAEKILDRLEELYSSSAWAAEARALWEENE